MSFDSIRLITFDCYGTLIDWESGMLAALRPLFSHNGHKVGDAQILELYGEIEAEFESGTYLPYREILSRTAQEIGRRLGIKMPAYALEAFQRHSGRIAVSFPAVSVGNYFQYR
jgi:2-haloacid dehalogenase